MDMSGRIKERRRAVGLSQKQLALHLGVSDMTVRRWETTSRKPDADLLPDLAKLLKTTTNYLLFETDDPSGADALPSSNQTDASQDLDVRSPSDLPQTQAAQDLDTLIKELAAKNPDLVIHLRSTAQNLKELSDEAKQAIADGLKYVLGLAELDDLPRLKKDGGRGRI